MNYEDRLMIDISKMSYSKLQQELKYMKETGWTSIKLNSKRTVLAIEYKRIMMIGHEEKKVEAHKKEVAINRYRNAIHFTCSSYVKMPSISSNYIKLAVEKELTVFDFLQSVISLTKRNINIGEFMSSLHSEIETDYSFKVDKDYSQLPVENFLQDFALSLN